MTDRAPSRLAQAESLPTLQPRTWDLDAPEIPISGGVLELPDPSLPA